MDQHGLSELGQPAMMVDPDGFHELEWIMQRGDLVSVYPLHHLFDRYPAALQRR
jgi:hypothetical protein